MSLLVLGKKHKEVVADLQTAIDGYKDLVIEKQKTINNLTGIKDEMNIKISSEVVKSERLLKKNKDLDFCLKEANKTIEELRKDNVHIMRVLSKNQAMAGMVVDIIADKSDMKFTRKNILELVTKIG